MSRTSRFIIVAFFSISACAFVEATGREKEPEESGWAGDHIKPAGLGDASALDHDPEPSSDSRLGLHRRLFGVVSLIEPGQARQRRMSDIAVAIGDDLPTVSGVELPLWLWLQQDAYWAAEKPDEALTALNQRYNVMQATISNHEMVVQAMREGDDAAARNRFPLSAALYDLAEDRAESEEDLVAAVLGRRHLILLQDGQEAVVDYLIIVRDQYLEMAPSLEGLAYLELAAEHNRRDRWPEARDVLQEVISRLPRTIYSEQAKVYLKNWKLTPGERRQLESGAEAEDQENGS